jgi:integrase
MKMASVQKRSNRTGGVSYRVMWKEPGPGGTRRPRNKSFARASDAKAFAARMEQEVEKRGIGDPQKHTLAGYLRRWIATLADRGEHSLTTIQGYGWLADIVGRHIGHIPLEKVSPADLDQFYAVLLRRGGIARKPNIDGSKGTRPLTARTVLHVHRMLHCALDRARNWKFIAENPAKDASAPTPTKSTVKAFTADQVQQLLAAAESDPETFAITALFLTCGLRRSEVLGLAFDAVDLEAGTLTIMRTVVNVDHAPVVRERAKTESSLRTIAIPAALVELLREQKMRVMAVAIKWGKGYQREPLLVFPGLAGAPMVPSSLTYRMRQVMRRAGVVGPSPCHAWRHTSATALIDAGQNIKIVQARLGHSTPAITMALYVHATKERDREAAEHLGTVLGKR